MKDNKEIGLEKILEAARAASLSVGEKSSIRGSLVHTINTTPIQSPFWNFRFIRSYHFIPAFLIALFMIGGGTSYFAQNALPGDALYSMKIDVNERVESMLATSPESLAEVSAVQANRRILEAELLAENNSLTPERDVEIQNNFSKKFDLVNTTLASLEGDTNADAGAEVRTMNAVAPQATSQTLSKSAKNDKTVNKASAIRAKFETELDNHEAVLQRLSQTSSSSPAKGILTFLKNKRGQDGGRVALMMSATATSQTSDNSGKNKSDDGEKLDSRRDNDHEDGEDNDNDDDHGEGSSPIQIAVPAAATVTVSATTTVKTFTMAEVASHNSKTSCYTTISGGVYDLTKWIAQHPGGEAAILGLCGKDGTAAFLAQHGGQGNPAAELATFKIGILKNI